MTWTAEKQTGKDSIVLIVILAAILIGVFGWIFGEFGRPESEAGSTEPVVTVEELQEQLADLRIAHAEEVLRTATLRHHVEVLVLQIYDTNRNGVICCLEAEKAGIAPVDPSHPAAPFMQNGETCE